MLSRFLHFSILIAIVLLVVSGLIVLRGMTAPMMSTATTTMAGN